MNDWPDTTNDSSMTKKSIEQQLWNRYSIASDKDGNFVEAKILDEIAGNKLANKYQTLLVSEMDEGTTLELEKTYEEIKSKESILVNGIHNQGLKH